jgi:His/Glu/Gln/Arg/opine family amino acid ABC transporter permease subunit
MSEFLSRVYATFLVDGRWKMFTNGLGITLLISFFAILLGTAIGIIMSSLKLSKIAPLRWIANVYIDIIRGTPTMVQILIINFIVFASMDVSKIVIAIIAFGINSGAYVAEIIRAGIQSVNKGQTEAGRSLGLSSMSTMVHIIMPQAIKNIMPALSNEFIVLIKETAVIGYIAGIDLTAAALKVQMRTYDYFVPLIAVAIIYYVVIKLFSFLLSAFERRLRKADAR